MNIFNYESKFSQITMIVADLIIVNLLYLVCCIPIVTIGAAQAGLFTAIRVLLDPEDDSSVAKAFFRGLGNGFLRITAVTAILGVMLAGMVFASTYALAVMYSTGSKFWLIACIAIFCVIYIVQCVSGPFHATFGCTVRQLLMNCLFLVIGYPIRCLLSAALILVPVVVLLMWPDIFAGGIVAVLTLYYSVSFLLIHTLLKKPFNRLKASFYEAQTSKDEAPVEETPALPEETEE